MKRASILIFLFIAYLLVCDSALCFKEGTTYMHDDTKNSTAQPFPEGKKGTITFRTTDNSFYNCNLELMRNGEHCGTFSVTLSTQNLILFPENSNDVFSVRRRSDSEICTIVINLTFNDKTILENTSMEIKSIYWVLVPKGKTLVCRLLMSRKSKIQIITPFSTIFEQKGNNVHNPEVKLTAPTNVQELFTLKVEDSSVGIEAVIRDSSINDTVSREIIGIGRTFMSADIKNARAIPVPYVKNIFTFKEVSYYESCSLKLLRNGEEFDTIYLSTYDSQTILFLPENSNDVFSVKRQSDSETCNIEIELEIDYTLYFSMTNIKADNIYKVLVPKGKTYTITFYLNPKSKVQVSTSVNTFFQETGPQRKGSLIPEARLTAPANTHELFTLYVGGSGYTDSVGISGYIQDSSIYNDNISREIKKPLLDYSINIGYTNMSPFKRSCTADPIPDGMKGIIEIEERSFPSPCTLKLLRNGEEFETISLTNSIQTLVFIPENSNDIFSVRRGSDLESCSINLRLSIEDISTLSLEFFSHLTFRKINFYKVLVPKGKTLDAILSKNTYGALQIRTPVNIFFQQNGNMESNSIYMEKSNFQIKLTSPTNAQELFTFYAISSRLDATLRNSTVHDVISREAIGSGSTFMFPHMKTLSIYPLPSGKKVFINLNSTSPCVLRLLRNGEEFETISLTKSIQTLVFIPENSNDIFSFKRGNDLENSTIEINLTFNEKTILSLTNMESNSIYKVLVPKGKTMDCTLSMNANSKIRISTPINTFFEEIGEKDNSHHKVNLTSPTNTHELFTLHVGGSGYTDSVGLEATLRESTIHDIISREIISFTTNSVPPFPSSFNVIGTIVIGVISSVLVFCLVY